MNTGIRRITTAAVLAAASAGIALPPAHAGSVVTFTTRAQTSKARCEGFLAGAVAAKYRAGYRLISTSPCKSWGYGQYWSADFTMRRPN